ncbi:MAG TPA: SPOR domain-containing protein [Gallionella sp.]|nr:SPOR domain-containing protein [Gallionella sp.]
MAKQQTEEESILRRKARRRLIGAIALTLAVVVILPMVLDSEPKTGRQDIELHIPAPDKVGEFVPGVAVSEMAEISPFAAPAIVDATTLSAESPDIASEVAQTDVARPVAASNANAGMPARVQPVVEKQPQSKAVDKPANVEGFVAQVGAYANAATAKKQLEELKKWGFRKAYTEKIDGLVRVRVGPYPEHKQAEQVRQLLEKHGLKPAVMSAH